MQRTSDESSGAECMLEFNFCGEARKAGRAAPNQALNLSPCPPAGFTVPYVCLAHFEAD